METNFLKNLGSINEEQGKRFYQDNKTMKERYQGVCVCCVCVCVCVFTPPLPWDGGTA